MQGRDFIFTSLQSWDVSIGANVKEIASEISKHNRVLFINSPLDTLSYRGKEDKPETIHRREVVQKKRPALRQINPNFWALDPPFTVLPVQFLPDGICFDAVNRLNNFGIYSYAKKVIKQLGFENPILFIDNDIYRSFYAKEMLKPAFTIFYIRDNLVSAYWKRHVPRLCPKICKKADVVLTNSEYYEDLFRPHNPQIHYIGQGVNLSQYNIRETRTIPSDLNGIPYPIIGYTGLITSLRLDADLLHSVAKARPNYSFVMVGKEDEQFASHAIHKLPNVFFLGEKPYREISSYISAFDVCINPQLINSVTNGNYPLKIDEYLALGKPAVATRTDFMKLFADTVWTCIGADEYAAAIDQALTENSSETISKRVAMAESHSWEQCVKRIYSYIP